jgi:TDG/mug DNA glycosylase family protein
VAAYRPAWLAVLGVAAYRSAFGAAGASIGAQTTRVAGAQVWLLPNPSGLNAHYQLAELAAEYGALRQAVDDR